MVIEVGFPRSKILSAKRLSQLIREANKNGERFCFILGSGASVESGIPSGNAMELQWMDCLMGQMEDRGTAAMDPDDTRRTAEALYAEQAIEHSFDEIEAAWRKAKSGGGPIPSRYYFDIYKLRFHANPRNGYSYLEKIMERCDPSLGYHTLAKLLTEDNLNNLVITTNFDSLVEDALFLYTDKKPLVVSHESLADYIEANIQRPIVAKVHRGLMYAPFNSPETTHELKKEWRDALSHAFNSYTPIVIGYAGGDRSLMAFLEESGTTMRHGVYWCFRGKPDQSRLPEENIRKFVLDKDGYFAAIDGFDALMMEIGKTMYGDAIRPGRTAERLRETNEKRIRRYNEQWDRLNKNPEVQVVLQPMNQAEQREEEERQEKEILTSWDYIRRGRLAEEQEDWETAVREYTKAIELDPGNAMAYHLRGIAYGALKLYEKAIKDYNKAIELNPDHSSFYNNRGVFYEDLRQYEDALKDYSKAIELDPGQAKAHSNRGFAYNLLGQDEKALADCDKAIELDPTYAVAYHNRGKIYCDSGQYKKAIENFSKAIELDPGNAIFYFNRAGCYYYELNQYDKALADFSKAIELDPKHKDAYLGRAMAYRSLGQDGLAEADEKAAAELWPLILSSSGRRNQKAAKLLSSSGTPAPPRP